jgi:hypothetical protein
MVDHIFPNPISFDFSENYFVDDVHELFHAAKILCSSFNMILLIMTNTICFGFLI